MDSNSNFTLYAVAAGIMFSLGLRYFVNKDKKSLVTKQKTNKKVGTFEIIFLVGFVSYAIYYYFFKR